MMKICFFLRKISKMISNAMIFLTIFVALLSTVQSVPFLKLGTGKCAKGKTITAVAGDTLWNLAVSKRIPILVMLAAQSPPANMNTQLQIGQTVCVPFISCAKKVVATAGQSYNIIATKERVDQQQLIAINDATSTPGSLFADQIVCIPRPYIGCVGFVVKAVADDSLFGLALKYRIPVLKMLKAQNPVATPTTQLALDQLVCIPKVDCESVVIAEEKDKDYTNLAKSLEVPLKALRSANGATRSSTLYAKYPVCVPFN